MKVIIAGPRSFDDMPTVHQAVVESGFEVSEIVTRWEPAKKLARINDLPLILPGVAKGFGQHAQMVEYAEALIAVWDGKSYGTGNLINLAREKGLKVYVKEIE